MELDLSAIAATPGASIAGDFSVEVELPEEVHNLGAVAVHLRAANTGRLLVVTGHAVGRVRLTCDRCLEEIEQDIDGDIDEGFSIRGVPALPGEATIDRLEPAAAAFHENILNLSELARQVILLNVPLQTICAADCRGLCPRCGQNLNLGPCDCPAEGDPRWEILKSLLESRKI